MQNWRGWWFCASLTDGGVSSVVLARPRLTAGGDSSCFCGARHLILLPAPFLCWRPSFRVLP
jgi:hypothetical protein